MMFDRIVERALSFSDATTFNQLNNFFSDDISQLALVTASSCHFAELANKVYAFCEKHDECSADFILGHFKKHLKALVGLFRTVEHASNSNNAGEALGEITAYAVYGELPKHKEIRFLN